MNIIAKTKDGRYFGNVKRVIDPLFESEHYQIEKQKRIIDEYDEYGNNITFASKLKYDNDHHIISSYVENDENFWLKISSQFLYKDGKLIQEISDRKERWEDGYGFDDENSEHEVTFYEYDKDILQKEIGRNSLGHKTYVIKYTYNDSHQIVKKTTVLYTSEWYGIETSPYLGIIEVYKYNTNKQLCEIKEYRSNISEGKAEKEKLSKHTLFYYDLEGYLKIKEEIYDAVTYTYKNVSFDIYGNVTKFSIIRHDNNGENIWIKIKHREYEYYE